MKLPLHDLHAQAGAIFAEQAGFEVPQHYGDEAGEYRAALDSAVVFDLSDRAKVEVSGPDARGFLHNLCTNDVKNLLPGSGCEAFLTTNKARVVAHVWINHLQDEGRSFVVLDAAAGQGEKIRGHLDHYLISEQVELFDRTGDMAMFRLAGGDAGRIVAGVFGASHDLAPLHNCRVATASIPIAYVRRQQLLILPGYDVFCPSTSAARLWQALGQAGARPAGRLSYEVLRVEAGLPEYGVDVDEERLAMEVGRTSAISYAKGCYLGQETIVMARDRGQVNRQLMGVTFTEDQFVAPGTKLYRGADEVGQITSAVFSPRLGKLVALAYLRRSVQAPGTQLSTEAANPTRWAAVTCLPFVGGSGASDDQ